MLDLLALEMPYPDVLHSRARPPASTVDGNQTIFAELGPSDVENPLSQIGIAAIEAHASPERMPVLASKPTSTVRTSRALGIIGRHRAACRHEP